MGVDDTLRSAAGIAPATLRDPPLVGRQEELAFVLGELDSGGCVIAGAPGVGKSRLALEAAERQREGGGSAERIVATAAAAAIPFGAFAHRLPEMVPDGRGPIPAYTAGLRRRSPGGQATLVLDDAQLLDEASAALLLALREQDAATLVVTIRSGEPAPDAVTALWKEQRLSRLDLEPLSRGESRQLVDGYLGASADAEVHAKVFALTEGNPLYVRELMSDALRSGALEKSGGRWRWTGTPSRMVRLRELIGARTRDLGEAGRDALELLAIGGPLRLDTLEALSDAGAVEELERAALARVTGEGPSPIVELIHPLYGEVTAADLPVTAARSHRRRLAAVLARRSSAGTADLLRLATLKLDAGESDPELFLRAAREALLVPAGVPGAGWGPGDPALAIRLSDAAGPRLEAALCGAGGRMALNLYDEVEERLAPLEKEARRASPELGATYVRTLGYALHWAGGGTEKALALLDRTAGWHEAADWEALHVAIRGWILLDMGRLREAVGSVERMLEASDLAAPTRLDLLVLLGLGLSRLGLIDHCEALEPEVRRLVDELEDSEWQTGWAAFMVDGVARAEAAQDLEGVADRLSDGRARAQERGDHALEGALSMVLGRLELIRGHLDDAIAMLENAADSLGGGDSRSAVPLALTYLARAQSMSGNAAGAEAALERAERAAGEWLAMGRLRVELRRAEAWVHLAHGRTSVARDELLAVAEDAGEDLMGRAEATYGALRLGAQPGACAQELTALAARAESELLDACAAHATAMADADPCAELQAARRFSDLGVDLFAAEAAARAARGLEAAGRKSSARRAAAMAAKHAARCQGARTPALEVTPKIEELTARELEVARFAAAGLPNAEIASELVLSVRTVETYVLRACRKLGVNRRGELAGALPDASEPQRAG